MVPSQARKPRLLLGIAGVLVMCAVSALFGWRIVTNATDLAYADGWTGTPGIVEEVSCLTDGSVTCTGQFQPNGSDGRTQYVIITGQEVLTPGTSYPAVLQSNGDDATVTGTRSTMETLYGVALFVLLFALSFGYGVVAFTQRLSRGRGWWRWGPSLLLKLTPAILAALFGLIAAISQIVAAHSTS